MEKTFALFISISKILHKRAWPYEALKKFKGQNNAGIKAREYFESLGYDGVNNDNEEYIAFNAEQVKSIDNLKPTSDPDIRYSISELSDTKRALQRAKERIERLQAEFKRTKPGDIRPNMKDVEAFAKDIKKRHYSSMPPKQIAERFLKQIYIPARTGTTPEGYVATADYFEQAAKNLSKDVVDKATQVRVDWGIEHGYDEARGSIVGTRLYVPDKLKA